MADDQQRLEPRRPDESIAEYRHRQRVEASRLALQSRQHRALFAE